MTGPADIVQPGVSRQVRLDDARLEVPPRRMADLLHSAHRADIEVLTRNVMTFTGRGEPPLDAEGLHDLKAVVAGRGRHAPHSAGHGQYELEFGPCVALLDIYTQPGRDNAASRCPVCSRMRGLWIVELYPVVYEGQLQQLEAADRLTAAVRAVIVRAIEVDDLVVDPLGGGDVAQRVELLALRLKAVAEEAGSARTILDEVRSVLGTQA